MMQLLAVIGLITVVVLMWKAFGPQPGERTNVGVRGPDDDPEFLWRLKRDVQKHHDEDKPE
ncbi:hypothetical protein [Smaragdicoccus niigatensis]|uniref:hypothetical protein n=1 Tax=Smaragdicoccus niigatensis TaxID=359359 RepID=UPI000362B841|nr:hypothetical protein [Smaragdicoccus niigatensis]